MFAPLFAIDKPGNLQFNLAGKVLSSGSAAGGIKREKNCTRIFFGVKDTASGFQILITAEVEPGAELGPLTLTTEDNQLSVVLQTRRAVYMVMPHLQLAKPHPNDKSHRGEVTNGKTHYRSELPEWHRLSRAERVKRGAGIIRNGAFRDTLFTLRISPVITDGRVVSIAGSFAGRVLADIQRPNEILTLIQSGSFVVPVTYAE